MPRVEAVRGLPSYGLRVRLMAMTKDGEREIGQYAFRHRGAE